MTAAPALDACPVVTLTSAEILLAANVGVMRQCQNLRNGRRDAHGAGANGWQLHIEGACGELAVAKYLGCYWSGALGNLLADDVSDWQVRTRSRDAYELIVHPGDAEDRRFVLVTGTAPRYTLRGWIYGWDAKRREWWRDPAGGRPAYFVPQDALVSMPAR